MLPSSKPPEYATKADLRELRLEISADIADIKLEVAKQISDLKSDLHKTTIMTLLGATGIFGTLVTILKLFS